MANINIFYSWQSDLPGAETRNFIQSCIDAAVKTLKDTVYVEANRDTRGNYGSPDITNVIFEKIQQCDIFVADVSIINSEHYELNENGEYVQIQKLSPNPNVLLELGYAAGVIGWENIICIANEDYGNANCMPFDLEHRRLTFYTLNNKDKAVVRKNIRNIIADTVMNVIENGVRPKNGMAAYRIGSYVNGEIVSDIVKYNPINSDYLKKNYDAWIKKIKSLVDEINTIKLSCGTTEISESDDITERLTKPRKKEISEESKILYNSVLNDAMGFVPAPDFWNLGDLKVKVDLMDKKTEYIGTEEEQRKIKLIEDLQCYLCKLHMQKMYWSTFEPYIIVPLAIANISTVNDTRISLYLKVENDSAIIINADRNTINPELKGVEGMLYEKIKFKEVLMMPTDENIGYDEDISYSINDNIANAKHYFNYSPFGNNAPQYDASDYEREIQKYFATSMENADSTYEFYIRSLQPNEKVWIGPALLLKPMKDEIEITYILRSDKTDGTISGQLLIRN